MKRIKIANIFLHLKKILIHKYWVFHYSCKVGIPMQGLLHDMSKFSFVEFWESVKYYQGIASPIELAKIEKGYSDAWMHHKGRNKHHYEYWIDGNNYLEMPLKYKKEMLCDYLGAGRAYNENKFTYEGQYEWWRVKNVPSLPIHEETRKFIDYWLKRLAECKGHQGLIDDLFNQIKNMK